MNRWWEIGGAAKGDVYDDRWRRMEERGEWVHGEADLVSWFEPASVLDAGCGTGRVAIELDRRGIDVVGVDIDQRMLDEARAKAPNVGWVLDDLADVEVTGPGEARRLFDLVVMAGNVMVFVEVGTEAAIVANMARHLAPGGRLVTGFRLGLTPLTFADYDRFAAGAGLELEHRWTTWDRQPYDGGSYAVTVHRRPPAA
ncbi:MAG: class I SAM-dependent methyltransferase [Acidimicrobiaceae bacterium]|nr:class I SAM-dependent methyltransferase [Acidimicrobiaceae bacterium]MDE0664639.1 class I SAM-dependent methyltransferase [Acidimicrobiaceae bacterium]MXW88718.1 class I SAM-dependent methyltransferase [Acidimicrobiaceae bacterium]MXY12305.1 class I SAM-dependent methyltransferase [Acidimicrobiaceae bacterium]MXZ66505.1 class I SAM-dependent methyltransferase [Acidimicrobiaceae bacterium]